MFVCVGMCLYVQMCESMNVILTICVSVCHGSHTKPSIKQAQPHQCPRELDTPFPNPHGSTGQEKGPFMTKDKSYFGLSLCTGGAQQILGGPITFQGAQQIPGDQQIRGCSDYIGCQCGR